MKFKKGDKVRITEPSTHLYNWVEEMDVTIGREMILDTTDHSEIFPWRIGEWWYNEDWLELIDNSNDSYDYAMGIV